MTFSRLPVEKYFLIPEGALGKWNSLATRLAWPGYGGKIRFHGVHCNTLHRIFRVTGDGILGPSASQPFLNCFCFILEGFKFRRERWHKKWIVICQGIAPSSQLSVTVYMMKPPSFTKALRASPNLGPPDPVASPASSTSIVSPMPCLYLHAFAWALSSSWKTPPSSLAVEIIHSWNSSQNITSYEKPNPVPQP